MSGSLTMLVARREVRERLSSKAFVISNLALVLVVFVAILFANWAAGKVAEDDSTGPDDKIAVALVGTLAPGAPGDYLVDLVPAGSAEEAVQMVRDGSVEAALVQAADGSWAAIGLTEVPDEVTEAATVTPVVQLLEPPRVSFWVQYGATYAAGILFFLVVMMFGQMAAQTTVVEKQTRVVEILLAAVPAKVLLAGKLLGNALLAVAEIAAMGVAMLAGLAVGGNLSLLKLATWPMLWFIAFFVLGFVLFSSLMAGTAATVSRMEDVSSVMTPVLMLCMIPYIIVVSMSWNDTVMKVMAWIPFSSPMSMPIMMLGGKCSWWEALASLALLALTTWLAVIIGGR
ncbi:MAG: ABC transporter permease, partial [Bifidobacteriaceae bacterium]|nr:ABC transporter permease [Bifidobacteriaceae bacterium]